MSSSDFPTLEVKWGKVWRDAIPLLHAQAENAVLEADNRSAVVLVLSLDEIESQGKARSLCMPPLPRWRVTRADGGVTIYETGSVGFNPRRRVVTVSARRAGGKYA